MYINCDKLDGSGEVLQALVADDSRGDEGPSFWGCHGLEEQLMCPPGACRGELQG